MQSHAQAKNSARQKVLRAETDLENYLRSAEPNPDHFERLALAVQFARAELFALLSEPLPEIASLRAANTPSRPNKTAS